jgi:hypothetical protein
MNSQQSSLSENESSILNCVFLGPYEKLSGARYPIRVRGNKHVTQHLPMSSASGSNPEKGDRNLDILPGISLRNATKSQQFPS